MDAETEASGETGDGYFASVSDLMVGVLFVFLLMLTVLALNYRDAEDQQTARLTDLIVAKWSANEQARIANEQALIAEEQKKKADRQAQENLHLRELLTKAIHQLEQDIESRQILRRTMLQDIEQRLMDRGVRVRIDERSGVLRLSGDLLFETGAETYRPAAAQTIRVLAEVLASILPCYAKSTSTNSCLKAIPILETVLVEGHTDRQPYRGLEIAASQARNDNLSTQRALTVFQTLRVAHPQLESLRNADDLPLLGVSGYGERRPLPDALGDSNADFERNRRIDVRFVLTSRTSEELERLRDQIRVVLEAAK
jgi:flagellar motor protein MotB